jgi:hypothetical protein
MIQHVQPVQGTETVFLIHIDTLLFDSTDSLPFVLTHSLPFLYLDSHPPQISLLKAAKVC